MMRLELLPCFVALSLDEFAILWAHPGEPRQLDLNVTDNLVLARIKVARFAGSECRIRIVGEQPGWLSIRFDQRDQRTAFRLIQEIVQDEKIEGLNWHFGDAGHGRQPLPDMWPCQIRDERPSPGRPPASQEWGIAP